MGVHINAHQLNQKILICPDKLNPQTTFNLSRGDMAGKNIINDLLKKNAKKLSDNEQLKLLEEADKIYGDDGRNWMEIGHCIAHVIAANPDKKIKERGKQFEEAFNRLSYQTGMKAKRVYVAYKDSPDEVVTYGLDLSDRLYRKYKSKKKRQEFFKKHGSAHKAKTALAGTTKAERPSDHLIGLGDYEDFMGAKLKTQTQKVVAECSSLAKEIRTVIKNCKQLEEDFVREIKNKFSHISEKAIRISVKKGRLVVEIKATKSDAQSRAIIIAACLGFEYLQRIIESDDRLINQEKSVA